MIVIVSNLAHEAAALTVLCTQRTWLAQACDSVAGFRRLTEKIHPKLVVTRRRLPDGVSDDVLAHLGKDGPTCVIVLAPADCPPRDETRQISLGADHVLRDPVRIEVLMELAARHLMRPAASATPAPGDSPGYTFAGVRVFPHEHRLERNGVSVRATPKVIELVQILYRNRERVASYALLYDELFGRHFAGDTANCRVLLAKADAVFHQLGVSLRDHITVIPKSGYLYLPEPADASASRPRFDP